MYDVSIYYEPSVETIVSNQLAVTTENPRRVQHPSTKTAIKIRHRVVQVRYSGFSVLLASMLQSPSCSCRQSLGVDGNAIILSGVCVRDAEIVRSGFMLSLDAGIGAMTFGAAGRKLDCFDHMLRHCSFMLNPNPYPLPSQ